MRWKFRTGNQIFSTPAVVGGRVYVHARDDHVYALDAEDGSLVWKTPAPSPQDEFSVFADMAKSSVAVGAELVYVGIGNALVALDRERGGLVWRTETGGRVDSSPLLVGDTVYVGSDDRNVYAFDAANGKSRWSFRTGGKVSVTPAVGEGMLLIGSNDGILYGFEPAR